MTDERKAEASRILGSAGEAGLEVEDADAEGRK